MHTSYRIEGPHEHLDFRVEVERSDTGEPLPGHYAAEGIYRLKLLDVNGAEILRYEFGRAGFLLTVAPDALKAVRAAPC